MGAQNIVSLGFNVEELTAEKKQVLDLFVDLFGQLKEYDGTKFNPLGNGGLVDLKKSLTDGAAAMAAFGQTAQKYNEVVTQQYQKQQAAKKSTDELTLATNEYKKIQDGIATTQAKSNAAGSAAAENLAIEKEQLKQRNAELQAGVKYLLSETGSVLEAKAAISQMTIERNKQNATTEEGKAKIAELNAEIDKNNKFINENTSAIEKQKNNVGNYAESLTPAFEALGGELGTINKQLSEIELRGKAAFSSTAAGKPIGFDSDRYRGSSNVTALASGSGGQVSILNQDAEAYQKLTVQQKILEQGLQREQIGFKTVGQEMRNVKNTLDALAFAGLQNTETFDKVNIAYTQTEQKVKDLHREQAILTTDAPALTALTGVARGLGGVYAFGAGASALFASGNEHLEKELNKLVAVMTFLQGLTEAVSVLKERNAIVTALEAEATKALNVVRQIEAAIFGTTTAAVEANTVAQEVNTEAQIVSTEAIEANTISAELQAVAVEGVAAAEATATAATITFRTALISTGIGAIIIGLIYGITKLVGAISDWVGASDRAEKAQQALAEDAAKLLTTYKELQEVYAEGGKKRIEDMLRESALQKDAGVNQFVQLATEKTISEQRLSLAKKDVDDKKINAKTIEDLNRKQAFDLEVLQGFEESLTIAREKAARTNKGSDKDAVESLEKQVGIAEAQAKNTTTLFQIASAKYKELVDSEHAVNENRIKTEKAAAEQLAKLTADSAQRRYDIEKDASDRVLNLPTASFSEKENATKAGYRADEELANAHIAAVRLQIQQQAITEAAGADEIANIQTGLSLKYKKAVDDRLKLRTEERDRNIEAQNAISKNNNEGDAAIQDAITKDTQKELDVRLEALKKNIDDKTAIIVDDYNTQIKLAKDNFKTDDEIRQLTSDRDKELVALTADTQKQIYDIVTSYGEKRLKAIEDENKATNTSNGVTDKYNNDTENLNRSLLNNGISYNKYLQDKRKLDEQYILDKDAADVADDERDLQRLRDLLIKKDNIELDFAQRALARAQAGGNDKEIKDAQNKVDALQAIRTKDTVAANAVNDKLGKDKQKQDKDSADKKLELDKQQKEATQQLEQASFDFAKGLVDASYEEKIGQIQNTINQVDEQAGQEVAAVQRSTIAQRDQAAEIIIIQGQQKAQDTALRSQLKAEKVKEAKFDRDTAVAEIIWKTGAAIMTVIEEFGFPAGFALAATVGAIGAIQAATVLAKPIPTYGDGIGIPGKGRHPGGDAIVGERWTPEKVSIPGYEPFILDKPTLLNLPADSSVLPMSPSDLVWEVGAAGMARTAEMFSQPRYSGNDEVVSAINSQTRQMKKALANSNRKIINKIEVHVDADWNNYLNKKVLGRG